MAGVGVFAHVLDVDTGEARPFLFRLMASPVSLGWSAPLSTMITALRRKTACRLAQKNGAKFTTENTEGTELKTLVPASLCSLW